MPSTYSEIKAMLDEVAERIRANAKRLARARGDIEAAEADLAAIPAQYADVLADLDAAAQANPADAAYQTAKAERDLLTAEFNALKSNATAMKDALDAVV